MRQIRNTKDMPKVGQRVVVTDITSSKYATTGKVVSYDADPLNGRPYTVQFAKGVKRKFRRGDVFKPSQVEYV